MTDATMKGATMKGAPRKDERKKLPLKKNGGRKPKGVKQVDAVQMTCDARVRAGQTLIAGISSVEQI